MTHDELSELYQTDPELFQVRCREMIDNFISSVPEERQQRLRQLQWTIDGKLAKYTDPVARMNKMVELFWEGVNEFNEALQMTQNRP